MGFNPHRQYRRKPADLALVVVTLVLVAGLLAWALFA